MFQTIIAEFTEKKWKLSSVKFTCKPTGSLTKLKTDNCGAKTVQTDENAEPVTND